MSKIYKRSNNGYVLFSDPVLSLLFGYRQYGNRNEAGGILLGYYRGIHIEIALATSPGPADRRSRFRFDRKCSSHQIEANKNWIRSQQIMTYIGEWHTHPEYHPKPSTTDLVEWRSNLPNQDMLLCIQGINELWVGEYLSLTKKVQELIYLE